MKAVSGTETQAALAVTDGVRVGVVLPNAVGRVRGLHRVAGALYMCLATGTIQNARTTASSATTAVASRSVSRKRRESMIRSWIRKTLRRDRHEKLQCVAFPQLTATIVCPPRLPDRGVRSLADSAFNPRASVAPGLRTAGEANTETVEGGGWRVAGDRPGDADWAALACHFLPLPFEGVPASLGLGLRTAGEANGESVI